MTRKRQASARPGSGWRRHMHTVCPAIHTTFTRYWLLRSYAFLPIHLASKFSFSLSNWAPKKNPSLAQPQDISRRPPCCIALGIQSGYTHWSLHPSDGHHPSCRTSGLGLIMYRWPEAKGASAATGTTSNTARSTGNCLIWVHSYILRISSCSVRWHQLKMENKSPLTNCWGSNCQLHLAMANAQSAYSQGLEFEAVLLDMSSLISCEH